MKLPEYRIAKRYDLEALENLLVENGQRPIIVLNYDSVYYVAEFENKIIGTIGTELAIGCAVVISAAVLEKWRGQKIALCLINMLLDNLTNRQVRNIFLFNKDSGSYWQKIGFHECDVKDVIKHLPNAPQVLGYLMTIVFGMT